MFSARFSFFRKAICARLGHFARCVEASGEWGSENNIHLVTLSGAAN